MLFLLFHFSLRACYDALMLPLLRDAICFSMLVCCYAMSAMMPPSRWFSPLLYCAYAFSLLMSIITLTLRLRFDAATAHDAAATRRLRCYAAYDKRLPRMFYCLLPRGDAEVAMLSEHCQFRYAACFSPLDAMLATRFHASMPMPPFAA